MSIRVILSVSSDIGKALAISWLAEGHTVIGTFRDPVQSEELSELGVEVVHCDLTRRSSIKSALAQINELCKGGNWETLVLAAGTQGPIGSFRQLNFDDWRLSMEVNFVGQVEFMHGVLKTGKKDANVIYFAGGGTNGTVDLYSAYTIAKIASIKLCELLDSEEPEMKFCILGPGWVRTKIHNETLEAGPLAGPNFQKTREMLRSGTFVEMSHVVWCVDWLIAAPKRAVGGRNFSAAHDPFASGNFVEWLALDSNRFKLRRFDNRGPA
jgi:NAD(P)-dependent dehydrogenase (short-subunit alcohol dehydrogenase family)